MSCRKCSSTCCPCSVCRTSGCHCTPARRRDTSSKAATGVTRVEASTSKPGGAATAVAVRHPDGVVDRHVGEQRAAAVDLERRTPVLASPGGRDGAAESLGHRLEAVAHPEDGHPRREDLGVDRRSTLVVDRGRAAGEDQRRQRPGGISATGMECGTISE